MNTICSHFRVFQDALRVAVLGAAYLPGKGLPLTGRRAQGTLARALKHRPIFFPIFDACQSTVPRLSKTDKWMVEDKNLFVRLHKIYIIVAT
jgi:hypothetical protein